MGFSKTCKRIVKCVKWITMGKGGGGRRRWSKVSCFYQQFVNLTISTLPSTANKLAVEHYFASANFRLSGLVQQGHSLTKDSQVSRNFVWLSCTSYFAKNFRILITSHYISTTRIASKRGWKSHDCAGATSFSDLGVLFDDSTVCRSTVLIFKHLEI